MAPSSMKPSTVSFASTQALASMASPSAFPSVACRRRAAPSVSEVECDAQPERLKVAIAAVEVNGAVRVLRGDLQVAPGKPVEGGGPDALAPAARRAVAPSRRSAAL